MIEYLPQRRVSGGVRLIAHKSLSTAEPILRGIVPPELVIALHQHRGHAAEPIVSVGQRVLKGELIGTPGAAPSAGVHASSSGRVRSIEERPVPVGAHIETSLCIVIDTDGEDRAVEAAPRPWPGDRAAGLERMVEGGIVGLGGAVFPTAAKLAAKRGDAAQCRLLIINGAECEPHISCDDMLMRECAEQIVAGARLMCDLVDAPQCVIAIEHDKPQAYERLAAAAKGTGDPRLALAELPTLYPAGGERQLIELLTGEEVPSGTFPSDVGYICQNVGTAYALQRLAIHDWPVTSRIVTVTGQGVARPRNVEVPIGTPIGYLIDVCGGYLPDAMRLIHGGSMMGYALPSDELPVTKATSAIIAAAPGEARDDFEEWACIRCGECAEACPARLQPQELLIAADERNHDDLAVLGLFDCIECGCCDVVCPSHIVLVERFRRAKRSFAAHARREQMSLEAAARFKRREERLAAGEETLRQQRDALKAQVMTDEAKRRQTIEAAVERARRRKQKANPDE